MKKIYSLYGESSFSFKQGDAKPDQVSKLALSRIFEGTFAGCTPHESAYNERLHINENSKLRNPQKNE